MVLDVVGTGATATKMNLFFAMNTLFGLAMLRVDGAAHDRWGTNGMLVLEFAIGVASLAAFLWLSRRLGGVTADSADPRSIHSKRVTARTKLSKSRRSVVRAR